MVKILTIESEFESAESLGYPTGYDFDPYTTKDIVIRWGNSEITGKEYDQVVNPSAAIKLNCHKRKALELLSTVVTTPKFYTTHAPVKGKVLIRPNSHSFGKGFEVVDGPTDIPFKHHGLEWIDTDLEYRVWFAWDRTLCGKRVRVVPDGPEGKGWKLDTSPEPDFPCRSEWGYSFRDIPDKLHTDTLAAAKVIGLHCGAADVLVKDGKFIFLELNSAPTIDTNKIRNFYKRAIEKNVVEVEKKNEIKIGVTKTIR